MVELDARNTTYEKTGYFAEVPLEVHVTDLGRVARRFVQALNQPCVGDEIGDLGEAADMVDLVEDHQCKDLSDFGDDAQQAHGYRVVFRNLCVDLSLDGEDRSEEHP